MKKSLKFDLTKLILSVILVLIFLYMLFLNIHTHKYHDEFVYSYIYGTQNKCNNLADVCTSLRNLYLTHNGRIISTGIMCVLLMCPKIISDILNSTIFTLLVYLVYKYCTKGLKNKYQKFIIMLLIFPMFWYTLPEFNGTVTWFSGAINYMWSTTFMLLYIFYLIDLFKKDKEIKNYKILLPLCAISLIIGSLHESIGIILTSLSFFLFFYNFTINKKINKLFLLSSIFSLIGFLSIVLAPGISIRSIATLHGNNISQLSTFKTSINMFINTINSNKFMFIFIGIFIIYLFIVSIKHKKNIIKNKEFIVNIFFLISGILIYIAMIKSPTFAGRVTFAPYILFVLAFFGLLNIIKGYDILKITILFFLLIYFSFNSYFSIKETSILIKQHYNEWKLRDEFIASEKKKGKKDILLNPITTELNSKMYGGDISYSPTYNHNGSMAMFYEVNSIRLKRNYYIDLNFSNLTYDSNNTDITLYNNTELLTEKISILPKDVYNKQAPFKRYKHSVDGGNITLYYGINDLNNITLKFNTNSKIFYLDNIRLYNYNNIDYTYAPNEIKKCISYLNDIDINVINNKLILNITGDNPYLKLQKAL